MINANVVNGRHFPEQEMVRLFHGTCLAVRAMHEPDSDPQGLLGDGVDYCMTRSTGQDPAAAQQDLIDDDDVDAALAARIAAAAVVDGSLCPQFR